INQVIETAKSITADRLHDRILEHHAKDEIGKIISTFNEMISRLDISFQQMKQFSADASHELRTPLTVMRSQLETAMNSRTSVAEMKKIVANCLDETIRMTGIIENLLLLAKGDAGQITMKQEVVDLSSLVRQTYDESVILASQKEISVTLEEITSISILGDAERLRQMLLNLIDNSIKYTPECGRIHLSLSTDDGNAKIVVADTGIGIPENEIPRIFNRFYRVDRARSREMGGTGLGLSIAQWIVHAHGGNIRVESKLNEGSEFSVLLPLNDR
ncbi:MAG: ATP-binding protein, partial [Ignavibacteriae bacterium]|nr:ATP-binding protein [Ignavibacteriota bacterium]